MMKTMLGVVLTLWTVTTVALANDGEAIKERMRDRKPALDALKVEGVIGETWLGYLAFVAENVEAPEQKALIDGENADRKTVYATIAAQTGSTTEQVGQRRALRLLELAKAGEWFQHESGEWKKK